MSIINKKLVKWSKEASKKIGLPRPFMWGRKNFDKQPYWSYIDPLNKKSFIKVPLPWQSSPENPRAVVLIQEHEDRVYKESLCPFCGVKFLPEDLAISWVNYDVIPTKDGPRVFSDYHPFHISCMTQARTFCPYMKKTLDSEFKTGTYAELRRRADEQIRSYLT